ncbi:SpoIIE family protein phosphatase [Streptomyces sp. NPDC056909]|uniref:ATP-binding SpoIIE family protein phosphatase n=1 Tax=Streptomyces sp. NPDC056909 TaxID=3345963 RepID=UPI0036AF75A5
MKFIHRKSIERLRSSESAHRGESGRSTSHLVRLSEASTRIGTTLDVLRTAQELADFTVPLIADYGAVDLAKTIPLGEEPQLRLGTNRDDETIFHRAGAASIQQDIPESIWQKEEPVFVPPNSPFTRAYFSRESYLEPELDVAEWEILDPGRAEKMRENGMHSLMMVPIHARGVVLGIAIFVRTKNPSPFDVSDLMLAENIVSRAALSLDNARRYTRERAVALALQRSLLPATLSGGSAVDLASEYLPADSESGVGGDWFDVIPLSGARVALVVGDVVGHGIQAAATMGRLRTAVQSLADLDLPPDELLTHLDHLILRLVAADGMTGEAPQSPAGATCLYVVYDPVARQCTMARAGHLPPAIVDADGGVSYPDVPAGPPLGLGPIHNVPYAAFEMTLSEGSLIALYTDGLVESRDADIDVGMDSLARVLGRPNRSLEELCSEAVGMLPTKRQSDDVALLLAATKVISPSWTATWELPATDPALVADARSLTRRHLAEWQLGDLEIEAEVVVSEMVTNAILHGSGPIQLRLIRDRVLICEVSDASGSQPRQRQACSTDENGRGLFLLTHLCNRWGSRWTSGGKIIWAEMDLPDRPPPTTAGTHSPNSGARSCGSR